MSSHRNQKIHACLKLMGSKAALARAMNVSEGTVTKWTRGMRPLQGAALRLSEAILAHPDEYMAHKRPPESGS